MECVVQKKHDRCNAQQLAIRFSVLCDDEQAGHRNPSLVVVCPTANFIYFGAVGRAVMTWGYQMSGSWARGLYAKLAGLRQYDLLSYNTWLAEISGVNSCGRSSLKQPLA